MVTVVDFLSCTWMISIIPWYIQSGKGLYEANAVIVARPGNVLKHFQQMPVPIFTTWWETEDGELLDEEFCQNDKEEIHSVG